MLLRKHAAALPQPHVRLAPLGTGRITAHSGRLCRRVAAFRFTPHANRATGTWVWALLVDVSPRVDGQSRLSQRSIGMDQGTCAL